MIATEYARTDNQTDAESAARHVQAGLRLLAERFLDYKRSQVLSEPTGLDQPQSCNQHTPVS